MGDSYSGQAGEDSKKVVSKTATAVGHAAGALSNVPLIGPYARATEEVASRLGRWADLFGFSKPRGTHDFTDERQRHLGTMAVTNDKDMARTLTMDVKNENTIDPRTVGLSGEDEMSIPHVCGKEALITRFSWSKNHDPDHELIRIPITPYMSSTFPQEIGEVLGLMLITVFCHARFLIGNLAAHTRRISDLPKRVLCLYRVARLIQW